MLLDKYTLSAVVNKIVRANPMKGIRASVLITLLSIFFVMLG